MARIIVGKCKKCGHELRIKEEAVRLKMVLTCKCGEHNQIGEDLSNLSSTERVKLLIDGLSGKNPSFNSNLYAAEIEKLLRNGTNEDREGIKTSLPAICELLRQRKISEDDTIQIIRAVLNSTERVKFLVDGLSEKNLCFSSNLYASEIEKLLRDGTNEDKEAIRASLSIICELLRQRKTKVDKALILCLGYFNEPVVTETLVEILRSISNSEIEVSEGDTIEAINAVGHLGSITAVETLKTFKQSNSALLRTAAKSALNEILKQRRSIFMKIIIGIRERFVSWRKQQLEAARQKCLICGKVVLYEEVPFYCLDCGFEGVVHNSCRLAGYQSTPGVPTFGSFIKVKCPKCGAST